MTVVPFAVGYMKERMDTYVAHQPIVVQQVLNRLLVPSLTQCCRIHGLITTNGGNGKSPLVDPLNRVL